MGFVVSHYGAILAALNVVYFLLSGVAQSLDAPTAQDTPNYRFWFKFVNYCAINWKRAQNNARIEDSPNFIPAAEAYMRQKLAEQGKAEN